MNKKRHCFWQCLVVGPFSCVGAYNGVTTRSPIICHFFKNANFVSAGENARICLAPAVVLAVSGNNAAGLCDYDTVG